MRTLDAEDADSATFHFCFGGDIGTIVVSSNLRMISVLLRKVREDQNRQAGILDALMRLAARQIDLYRSAPLRGDPVEHIVEWRVVAKPGLAHLIFEQWLRDELKITLSSLAR